MMNHAVARLRDGTVVEGGQRYTIAIVRAPFVTVSIDDSASAPRVGNVPAASCTLHVRLTLTVLRSELRRAKIALHAT